MINVKKSLYVSVAVVLALAFCGLIIGQAAIAEVKEPVNKGQNQFTVPLPSKSVTSQAALSSPYGPAWNIPKDRWLYEDRVLEPMLPTAADRRAMLEYPSGIRIIGDGPPKGGGEGPNTAVVIDPSSATFHDVGTTVGASDSCYDDCHLWGPPTGVGDLWYSFTPLQDEQMSIDLCASLSSRDTYIMVYEDTPGVPGAGSFYACDDDGCGNYLSILLNVDVYVGHTYYIVVDGWDEGPYDFAFSHADWYTCVPGETVEAEACGLSLNDYPGPFPQKLSDGETICGTLFADGGARDNDYYTFDVTNANGSRVYASGSAEGLPFFFIYYADSMAGGLLVYELGSPGEFLSLELYFPNPGTYTVRVAPNLACPAGCSGWGCGDNPLSTLGWRYKLTLDIHDVVPLDDCDDPAIMTDTGVYIYNMAGMTSFQNYFGLPGPNMWVQYSPTWTGICTAELCNDTAFDATATNSLLLFRWDECGGSLMDMSQVPWGLGCPADGPATVSFPAISGEHYMLELDYFMPPVNPNSGGTLHLTQEELPPLLNDDCLDAILLDTMPEWTSGDVVDLLVHNVLATTDGPLVSVPNAHVQTYCSNANFGADVWYIYPAPCNGIVEVDICTGAFDGKVEVYEGTACPIDRLPIACDDDGCGVGGGMPVAYFEATSGQDYLIRMGGWYRIPDFPVPAMGVGVMNITCGVTLPAVPWNDDCADVTPAPLTEGSTVTHTGDNLGRTNWSCLSIEPAAWDAFHLDTCADIWWDYCNSADPYHWITAEILLDGCPCYDATYMILDHYDANLCVAPSEQEKTMFYNGLLPGDYYFPILPGFEAHHGVYEVNINCTYIECVYCDASGNVALCVAGGEYISNVELADIDQASTCMGYEDYLGVSTTLYRAIEYTIEVQTTNSYWGDEARAWIDWEDDFNLYKPANNIIVMNTTGGGLYTGTFTVATDAPLGDHLLRVRLSDTTVTGTGIFPCGDETYGEVEDYTVTVDEFLCGDVGDDGIVDTLDIQQLEAFYFDYDSGAAPVPGLAVGDVNNDGVVNFADIIYISDYLYRGGPAPVCY